MKYFLISLLMTSSLYAVEYKDMDMAPGTWEYRMILTPGDTMSKMFAEMPKEQRAAVMKSMIKRECHSAEDIANWKIKMKEDMGKNKKCKLTILVSEKRILKSMVKCKGESGKMIITTKLSSRKEGVTDIYGEGGDGVMTSKMAMKWLSATCKK